jgi:hypothetical protein
MAGTTAGTSSSQTPTTVWSANMFARSRTASVNARETWLSTSIAA